MSRARMTRADQAQLAMMLEVCAFPKPGNVDRCHDYSDTRLEHFLASTILVRPVLDEASQGSGSIGMLIHKAVERTGVHSGGNTHFGAFLLLFPLVMAGDINNANKIIRQTTVEDAVEFYRAFGKTKVRVLQGDELDVCDPEAIEKLRERRMTLYDIMLYSAANDMVAREWVNGFQLTRRGADLLFEYGCGPHAVTSAFITLLSTEPDTFIIKKHGREIAWQTMKRAMEVREGYRDLSVFDQECIDSGINPGSIADIVIASIYVALGEGWQWDC